MTWQWRLLMESTAAAARGGQQQLQGGVGLELASGSGSSALGSISLGRASSGLFVPPDSDDEEGGPEGGQSRPGGAAFAVTAALDRFTSASEAVAAIKHRRHLSGASGGSGGPGDGGLFLIHAPGGSGGSEGTPLAGLGGGGGGPSPIHIRNTSTNDLASAVAAAAADIPSGTPPPEGFGPLSPRHDGVGAKWWAVDDAREAGSGGLGAAEGEGGRGWYTCFEKRLLPRLLRNVQSAAAAVSLCLSSPLLNLCP